MDEWLPERHLAWLVAEVVDQLDLSKLMRRYLVEDPAYHPGIKLLGQQRPGRRKGRIMDSKTRIGQMLTGNQSLSGWLLDKTESTEHNSAHHNAMIVCCD